jgi:hypothetical protein
LSERREVGEPADAERDDEESTFGQSAGDEQAGE